MIFSKLENNYELQANLFSIVIHFGLFIFMLLTIQWQMKDVYYSDIELWDAMGRRIWAKQVENSQRISVQAKLNPGIYLVKVQADGKNTTRRLVIE